ncbi:MAG: VCBS repeat-containing protein [Candidatus Hydrogenedentes bacterium]|nr:VCBS repeat-containing protein [Candidatus Hydrogenedentota bacterium]
MISAVATLTLLAGGALLQVQMLPWTPEKSACFTTDVNLDGRAEICILQEQLLHIYGRRSTEPLYSIALPARTTAIDIADVDNDGVADLIALRGEDVLRYALSGSGAPEPEVLFTQQSQFSRADGYPFPAVLIVDRGDGPLIALPTEEALEVRKLSGELVNSYPIGVNAPYHVSIGKPFSYWVNQHAQSGPADALEFRVNRLASFKPLLPDDAFPIDVAGRPPQRLGLSRQQWEADAHRPESWPWFSIAHTATEEVRGLYRQSESEPDATSIRVRTLPSKNNPETAAGEVLGPSRLYPGSLVLHAEAFPDFNGDGFSDIMLWKAPRPGLSADGLSRALTSSRWPLNITTHVYLPEKKRFSPRPQTLISMEIPVAWFMAPSPQGPLQALVLRDFNGDGRTDFGCLTAEDTFTAWQAEGEGLAAKAAIEERFPSRVDEVMFETDLDGQGTTSIALRCGEQLAILRPSPVLPSD